MISTELQTVRGARVGATSRPFTDRWTCDDESYWGSATVTEEVAAPAPRRSAPVRRRPVSRDVRRPHAGAVEYTGRSVAVSRVPHVSRPVRGLASVAAVVLVTAATALGLVGVANLRAVDVPPQPTMVEQLDLGVSPR